MAHFLNQIRFESCKNSAAIISTGHPDDVILKIVGGVTLRLRRKISRKLQQTSYIIILNLSPAHPSFYRLLSEKLKDATYSNKIWQNGHPDFTSSPVSREQNIP